MAALEHPDVWGGLIDIDGSETSFDALIAQLGRNVTEHVALREGTRYIASPERIESASPTPARLDATEPI